MNILCFLRKNRRAKTKTEKEEEVWKIIDERCNKWRYVFDFSNPKDERFKILEELLEDKFKVNSSQKKLQRIRKPNRD